MGNQPGNEKKQEKHWKKLGITAGHEIGSDDFEKIWLACDGTKTSLPISQANKFLKQLAKAAAVEWDPELARQLINKVNKDNSGTLSYEDFRDLFFDVSDYAHLSLTQSFKNTRDMPKYRKVDVRLTVYDLQENLIKLNTYALHLGFGAFHTGVEIFDTEISYCEGKGIHQCLPKTSHIGEYRESIDMGQAQISPNELLEIIAEMSKEYTGDNYDLYNHNCNHFCDTLCLKIVHHHVPKPIMKLAKFACHFRGIITIAGSTGSIPPPLSASATPRTSENDDDSVARIVSLIIEDDPDKIEKKQQSMKLWIQAMEDFNIYKDNPEAGKNERQINLAKLAIKLSSKDKTEGPDWK